jgi:peptidoglycan/xylan/chitin deacetylase (PgdA/CDA1 family)/glycosyltransferase involved in cell wall biosynthesis
MSSGTAVVITCYDLGRTLPAAIESAFAQTLPPTEVVVVDDGSEDPFTLHVLDRLAHERPEVMVIRGEHGGPAAARNRGMDATSAARGVFLDGDDLLEPTYLELATRLLDKREDLSFVCCALQAFGEASYRWKPPPYTIAEAIGRGACGHISTVFERELWDEVGGFATDLPAYEDVDFWLRALELGYRGAILDEALLRYRVRPGSRYHGAVVHGGYLTAKRLLLERHSEHVSAHGEDVLVALIDFERELTGHARTLTAEQSGLQRELREVEDDIAAAHAALDERGIPALDWGELGMDAASSRVVDAYADVALERLGIQRDGRRTAVITAGDEWPTRRRAYDLVIVDRALEATAEGERALEQCREAMRPGGRLVVLTSSLAIGERCKCAYTEASLRSALGELFPPGAVSVTSYGNLLTSLALVAGMPPDALQPQDAELSDPLHPVLVAGVAELPRRGRARRLPAQASPLLRAASAHVGTAAAILAYHRVADHPLDSHGLCTPPEAFASHMELIAEKLRPLPLSELAARLRARELEPGSVAVTFDDGYLDNLDIASPILEKHGVPATFFVSGPLDDELRETWADRVERILLGTEPVPERLRLESLEDPLELPTGTAAERRLAADALHGRLLTADGLTVAGAVAELTVWSGRELPVRDSHRLMTADELLTLATKPGHEIGAHGWDHLLLPAHPAEARRADLERIQVRLGELLDEPPASLAYPYGACDLETTQIAEEAGFAVACSVEPEGVTGDSDPLRLPRIEIRGEDVNDLVFRIEQTAGLSA